jgi:alanine-synthesizing transaminase
LAKLGISLNAYYLNESDGWQPDLDDIRKKITTRTRAIVLINPNNPTGSVCSRRMLEQIADIAREHNLVIFSDEIYDKLILEDDEHVAMAAVAPDVPVVTFGGLSKNYLAPGWRIGWGILSGDRPPSGNTRKASIVCACVCVPPPSSMQFRPRSKVHKHLEEVTRKNAQPRDLTVRWCNSTPRELRFTPRAFYAYPLLISRKATMYSSPNSC